MVERKTKGHSKGVINKGGVELDSYIDYKPNLSYTKDIHVKSENHSDDTVSDVIENVSAILSSLDLYSPSVELCKIDLVSADIQSALSSLSQRGYNEVHSADVTRTTSMELKGDTSIIIYDSLDRINREFAKIRKTVSLGFFGEIDASSEKVAQNESKTFEKLKSYEYNGNNEKINYAAVYSDVIISKMIDNYIDGVAGFIDSINDYGNNYKYDLEDEDLLHILNQGYADVSLSLLEINNVLNSMEQSNVVNSNIIKLYNARTDLIWAYDRMREDSSDNMREIYKTVEYKFKEAIVNAFKAVELNNVMLADYKHNIKKKDKIQSALTTDAL